MRPLRNIGTIVLHCSDSNRPAHDDISVIDSWHKQRGFDFKDGDRTGSVGYHYFIKSTGEVQRGRPLDIMGAHVAGHNAYTVGICLHGKDFHDFNEAQYESAASICNAIMLLVGKMSVVGHCDLDPVNKPYCPGFDVKKFAEDYM
jgi:N-acetylmuramoyl-L-alanine amidase